jgi:hypothetical protein
VLLGASRGRRGLAVGRRVVLGLAAHPAVLHRQDFGVTDPLFHKDVGFFVFSLPLYSRSRSGC